MKLKNLSSVILAAMMAATSVPAASLIAPYNNLSAYAVETAEPEEEAPIAWGMCGENLTWEVFAEEDSLVIDGTGAMTEWESAEDAPWAEYGDRISLIVIRENVESISENAFGATRGRIFFFNSYDCVIPDNETFLPENASIYGYDGSTAQAYAEKYGREFTSEGEYVGPSDENISSDENNSSDEDDSTMIEGDRVVAEGICGENLKWEIDSLEDILIISGYGEMTDWEKPEDAPWFEYSDEFDIVIIRPGVAEISENSFGSNVKIVYLTSYNCVIPDSETAIPADALIIGYYNSTAQAYAKKYNREFDQLNDEGEEFPLMEGVCTENLEWILWNDGSLSFYGYGDIVAENGVYPWDVVADSVKEITISTAVRSIGENAFTNCTNLESVLMYTPDCKIADSADVFPSDVLLSVGDGSTAEEYAIKYNLTYDVYNFFTASGKIGDNLSWLLINGGSLRIYGVGDMIDLGGESPWAEYEDEITRVQINEEVTSIDKAAFEGCDNIADMIVLNPNCKFAESEDAIPEDVVIWGAEGSGALMYAQMFGRDFKILSLDIVAPEEEEESYIAYGELGENLTWTLHDDGSIYINGEGEMLECGEGGYPWSEFADKIKNVELGKEVTSIGAYAFYNCINLESMHLAPVIGEHAYDGCINAGGVGYYSDLSVNEIGDYAFNNCGFFSYEFINPDCVIADSEFVFPTNATIWGYVGSTAQAHAEKYGLEFVEITSGEQQGVAEGELGDNLYWTLDDGNLNIIGNGDMIEIDGVYPWDEYADQIKTVFVNENVTSISTGAFDNCANVQDVWVFNIDCVIADVDNIFPANAEIYGYNGSTTQAYAEKYNKNFVALMRTVADGKLGENLSWLIDEGGAININGIGDMIEIDGVYPWDEYADQITTVNVLGDVTSISAGAFDNCANIEAVWIHNRDCVIADVDNVFPANAEIYGYNGSAAQAYAEKYNKTFIALRKEIVGGEFGEDFEWSILDDGTIFISGIGEMPEFEAGCYPWSDYSDMIKNVELAKEVTSIGAYAFYNCTNLETVHLASVIGEHAYDGCINADSVGYYSDLTVNEIGDYAFNNCGVSTYEITNPDCVIADSEFVFPVGATIEGHVGSTAQAHAEKYGLKFVDITETTVEKIADGELGNNLFWNLWSSGILNIYGNGDMIEIDGAYPWDEYADQITSVYVNENVTSISAGAFDDCVNLRSANIKNRKCVIADVDNVFPANVSIYGYNGSPAQAYAEKYNKDFTAIRTEIVSGKLGKGFEWTIFDDNTILIDGVGEMPEYEAGNYPWSEYSDMIKDIQLGKEVTSIGAYAFYNCINLESMHLASVIGEHAYDGCINVGSVSYASDLIINEIGDYAFNNCGFTSYTITNPDCVIADSEFVFPSGADIWGYAGSTAQAHAEKYGLEFVEIEGEPVTTTVTTAPDSDSTTTTTTTTANDSESELPQTGFSRAYDYLAFSAGVMALCGIYAMKKGKKKEDEE